MNPTVRALKQQILRTHPSNLRRVIEERFVGDQEELFNVEWLTDALAAAIQERPSIADAICPWLAKSNSHDLVAILLEVIPAMWPDRTELLLKTLEDARNSKDKGVQMLVANTLTTYKDPAERFNKGFRRFLMDEGY